MKNGSSTRGSRQMSALIKIRAIAIKCSMGMFKRTLFKTACSLLAFVFNDILMVRSAFNTLLPDPSPAMTHSAGQARSNLSPIIT